MQPSSGVAQARSQVHLSQGSSAPSEKVTDTLGPRPLTSATWSLRLASTDAQPLMAQEHRSRTTEQASWVALVVKNPPARAGAVRDEGAIPGLGRSPREGNDNPLQYSCLGNLMDRGVHGVAKSQT